VQKKFVFSSRFTENDVALVSSNKEFTFWKPAVCSVITTNVLLLLVKRRKLLFKRIRVLHFEVSVSVIASHEHYLFICIAEANLCARNIGGRVCKGLLTNLFRFLPLPNVDCLMRVASQSHEQALVVWAEGDTYELFGLDVVARDELFATQVWSRKVVDCTDWVF